VGKLTQIGHISRGLDFMRQRSSVWLGLGRTTPWPNEEAAPAVDTSASTVEQLYGLVKLDTSSMLKLDSAGAVTIKGKTYSVLSNAEALTTFGNATTTDEIIATPSVDTDTVTVAVLKNTPLVSSLVTVTATDEDGGTMTMTDQSVDEDYGLFSEASVANSPVNYIDYKTNASTSRVAGTFTDGQLEKNKLKFSKKVKANTNVLASYTYTVKGNYLYLKFELGVNDFPNIDYRQYGVFVDAQPKEGYANSTVLETSKFSSLGNLVYLDNVTVRKRYTNTRHLIEIVIEE
jgi:hypothetical protein